MNMYTRNLPVCNSGQNTYVTGLFNFFIVLQDLKDRIDSYFQGISEELASYWLLTLAAFTGVALCKLERRKYGGKWPGSIKYQNLRSFKEVLIL